MPKWKKMSNLSLFLLASLVTIGPYSAINADTFSPIFVTNTIDAKYQAIYCQTTA